MPAVAFCHPALCAVVGCLAAAPPGALPSWGAIGDEGAGIATVELRYGGAEEGATADCVRYIYAVDVASMAVVETRINRGYGYGSEPTDADVVLVDCGAAADSDPEPRWGDHPEEVRTTDLSPRDCTVLAAARSEVALRSPNQHVWSLAEVLGRGARALSACPNALDAFVFRV